MRTRFAKLVLLGFGVAMAVVLLCTLSNREPEYQGKRLSAWFKQYYRTGQHSRQWNDDEHHEAAQALRAMGTNAVPFLTGGVLRNQAGFSVQNQRLRGPQQIAAPVAFPALHAGQ